MGAVAKQPQMAPLPSPATEADVRERAPQATDATVAQVARSSQFLAQAKAMPGRALLSPAAGVAAGVAAGKKTLLGS